ncbi:MAG TPA: protein kinase, partial [Polyangiaceae bacterium]|nr:protein kinase [Polyangiaceae bacterium]
MTQRDLERSEQDGLGDGPEARLARARMAFDQGLREVSETGARAARQLVVPALWGAALVGGTLLAIAVLRLVRRPTHAPALLRVSIEPRLQSRSILPALGGAVARFAVQRLLEAPAAGSQGSSLPEAHQADSRNIGSQGHRLRNNDSHNNGSRAGSMAGRASACTRADSRSNMWFRSLLPVWQTMAPTSRAIPAARAARSADPEPATQRSAGVGPDSSEGDELILSREVDVSADEPHDLPQPGDIVGGTYRVLAELGRGSMGVVLSAFDQKLERPVAIKLIRAELLDSGFRQRFLDEARVMAQINHPNVVCIHALGEHGSMPYFVMELVEGTNLEQWLRRSTAP